MKESIDTVKNRAGGHALELDVEQSLALYSATNTFSGTYYASSEEVIGELDSIINGIYDNDYLLKCALFSKNEALLRDFPIYILYKLALRNSPLFEKYFNKIITNGSALQKICFFALNGKNKINISNRKWKRVLNNWFRSRTGCQIFNESIGNDPSIASIILLAHIKPESKEKAALYAYLRGAKVEVGGKVFYVDNEGNKFVNKKGIEVSHDFNDLPENVKCLERFKVTRKAEDFPNINFRFLDSLGLTTQEWSSVAYSCSWKVLKNNIVSFYKKGVFEDKSLESHCLSKLKDKELIKNAKVMPYEILTAYKKAKESGLPQSWLDALSECVEFVCSNSPSFQASPVICVDTSGSMQSPVAVNRKGGFVSSTSCLEVAGLFTSVLLRSNPDSLVIPFAGKVKENTTIKPENSVFENVKTISDIGGGATDVSSPIRLLNQREIKNDLVIIISDYESFIGTTVKNKIPLLKEWGEYKRRNPYAKLVCLDLSPRMNHQVNVDDPYILQVGGFSDNVFVLIRKFLENGLDANYWVKHIKRIEI